ncbi:hypothetical protein JCM10914A_11890 [Paenibacillus sp. JCM 10914]|uniref:YxlC family protein n=1 Tax=Paenibacillus sp. JCM 10914 TaxID=1236974 RepID=UPI0003CC62B5|nr:YxlC family protein [Paenibacillus sp. JCM 10914]GAE09968.1 hypothetical protein JCM10914_6362 [Paenibacillus sp. JCM 10914]
MSNDRENEEQQWLDELNREFRRVDQTFEDGPEPSLKGLQMLAEHTIARRRRRMKYELLIFLMVAFSVVGGGLLAALAVPMALVLIQGIGMLAGVGVLVFSKKLRESGKKGIE